jgi:hypothetical protein
MNTEVMSNEIPEVEDTSEANASVPARNYFGFMLFIFRLSTVTCKVKLKCTLVQALRLCTGRTAHRGSRGIALLYRH